MTHRWRRAAAALAGVAALALTARPARAGEDGYAVISAGEVEQMLGAPDVKIYDVNVDELWEKHHLPGALHLGKDLASQLPADKSTRLVFYCSGPK